MRIALISDIHSNLEALESVLERLVHEEVDFILNLGDLVGYNANPAECLALLKSRPDIHNLAGNHDLALLSPERAEAFNIIAYQALKWCREQVQSFDLEFLQRLPLTLKAPGFWACHGTPTSPDTYIAYHFQGKQVLRDLSKTSGISVCFFGHTHHRALWYRDIRGKVGLQNLAPKIDLNPDGHYLINPGSVGQPRDGSPEAAYAVFDDAAFSIQFKSVPYDVAAAQHRILRAGLPPYLAERLAYGK
ncbi:MAG: metallophosphatase family protein [Deltaproteobacteria bacterium]|nr:metallophosphatase family protein [Deltaproteobacteria bacterium]